jgi:splicing factor U2AF 35 kDa subunit
LIASIYGTEQDKVNCSFYFKIGACRHGDRCSRKHIKPQYSQTILVSNVWQNPKYANVNVTDANNPAAGPSTQEVEVSESEIQRQFDEFYEDFYVELGQLGSLVEMHVCDNVGEHLIGNVYARYKWEEDAQRAVDALNDRWYNKRPLFAELSPVTDFREACCRQHETNDCQRGGFCNFMHVRTPNRRLLRDLQHEQAMEQRIKKEAERNKSRGGGWKEEIGSGRGGEGDWRKGASGGDWRSGQNGHAEDRRRSISPVPR